MFKKTFFYYQRICQNLRPNVTISNILYLYGEELADHPTLELEDCLLLDVHGGFFNIFTTTHHMWRLCSPCDSLGIHRATVHSVNERCIEFNDWLLRLVYWTLFHKRNFLTKQSWNFSSKSQAARSLLVKHSLCLKRLWKILQYFSRFYLPAHLWVVMLR